MSDTKVQKTVTVIPCTNTTIFENFESLSLIDAGATDGFQIQDAKGVTGVIPTGIVVNIGGIDGKVCSKIIVLAASGKSLNVTAIMYQ
jgi:hypothetical protein